MTKENKSNKHIKKTIILILCFSFIIIAVSVFAALKSDYFVIKNVLVENNLFVTKEEISLLSELKGQNIFLVNKNKTKQKVELNPYIENVAIKRKFPSTIILDVTEKKIRGIIKISSGLINIDSEGRMVQMVNHFPNGKIPLILGVKVLKFVPNDYIVKNDENKLSALKAAMTVSNYNESRYVFYSVNVSDPFNIVLVTNDHQTIKIGDWTNMDYKIAYVISLIKDPSTKGLKGYFQLQPDGSAIFKKI